MFTRLPSVKSERGAVAILTVLFLVIILSILSLGFLRLSITEQQQSSDDDLSARAYYGAEAGVTDARVMLKQAAGGYLAALKTGYDEDFGTYLNSEYNASTCKAGANKGFSGRVSAKTDLDIEYTCLRLLPKSDFQTSVGEDDVDVVILPGLTDGVDIEWHQVAEEGSAGIPGDGSFTVNGTQEELLLRKQAYRQEDYPALLRATFFYREADGTFKQKTAYLYPKNFNETSSFNFTNFDGGVLSTRCNTSTSPAGFACRAAIRNLPTTTDILAVALKSIYRDTTIRVTASRSGSGTTPGGSRIAIDIDKGQVVADSTGRSGTVFRRVEAYLNLSGLFFKELLNIDDDSVDEYLSSQDAEFITISGKSLCKTFNVGTTARDFSGSQWCVLRD